MKTFTVYLEPKGNLLDDTVYIAEGFSWLAFIFNFFWLVYHKLWLHGFVYFLILMAIQELYVAGIIHSSIQFVFQVGMMVYIGFAGRDFIRKRLEKEGYEFAEVILANSQDEAEYKFIDSLVKMEEVLKNEKRNSKSNG